MSTQKENRQGLIGWIAKTTLINVLLVMVCFAGIIAVMVGTFKSSPDLTQDIIGKWCCEQFYKNQKSFKVPENQNITISIIDERNIALKGSENASIFRGANRQGTYTFEGGNTLYIDMGNETWTCACVFTQDGLLRMTISEAEIVLYLRKVG